MKKNLSIAMAIFTCFLFSSCNHESKKMAFTGAKGEVKLMTLDPGHFHAALIQKNMYEQVSSKVYVYAPQGDDLNGHLKRIDGFNRRTENPTSWDLKVYTGNDFFEKMIHEKPGNLINVSGNNAKKTEYIIAAIEAGIHVLADKPMAIHSDDFALLEKAFLMASEKGVLLYDVMTERYEITTLLQRELSQIPELFGTLKKGSAEEPAITKESVHHFSKLVSGKPLKRPAWFFDTDQQGEGMVDVNTHLVDLIQWEAFPNTLLSKNDVEINAARRWTTDLTPAMFEKVTHLKEYPEYLKKDLHHDTLKVYCNGEIIYQLKGVYAKALVEWNFEAPNGAKDTHYSIMRGTKCDLIIEQGEKESYKPKLYIKSSSSVDLSKILDKALSKLNQTYPGIGFERMDEVLWTITIPDKYNKGHEAHFSQVTRNYLRFLKEGKLPEWEVPNMITKYYTTTKALEIAKRQE